MGNLVEEAMEGLPSIRAIKVHARMCSQLSKVVTRVSNVFKEIEEARPRCSSGIEALCLLSNGISKAKSLIQQCSESSALYLCFTGKVILTRCKKSCIMMEQSLRQLQNMVPVLLAAKISGIVADLRSTSFSRDESEEEAEKILRDLIHRYSNSKLDSTDYTTVSDIHAVASRLQIASQKSLVTEKRAIKRIGRNEPSKKGIVIFFLELLKIYGNLISSSNNQRGNEYSENITSYEIEHDNHPIDDVSMRPVPPEEFVCPLSSRLMSDPVVISSGQTYERTWIQRWFDEGKTTCPSMNMELENLSYIPNKSMKLLIQKWCSMHRVSLSDHSFRGRSLDTSLNSIASLSSSIDDLNLRIDYSSVSIGSSQGSVEPSHLGDLELVNGFDSLPWERRCKAIEDLKNNSENWPVIPLEALIKRVVGFLKDSHRISAAEALVNGCVLLLEILQKQRSSMKYVDEDACVLLASLLDATEVVSLQALSILNLLSSHRSNINKISNSGALLSILSTLGSRNQEDRKRALCILANVSSNRNLCSFIDPQELIPKLIHFLKDDDDASVTKHCLTILNGMIDNEGVRRSIAETDGCIASIANLLEDSDSHEVQEHAVSVFLSLCSQRAEYCKMVMEEGVIPGLVSVSVNGNDRAKAMAMELLRILRIESDGDGKISEDDFVVTTNEGRIDEKPHKARGLFRNIFSRQGKRK